MSIPKAVTALFLTAMAAAGQTNVIAAHAAEPAELTLEGLYLVWLGPDGQPIIDISLTDQVVQASGQNQLSLSR